MTLINQRLRAPLLLASGLLLAGSLMGGCGGEATGPDDLDDVGLDEDGLGTRSEELTAAHLLTPVLTCMDQLGTNSYRAHFGYVNASSRSVRVPIGLLNFFVPLPKGQGQPIDFAPGSHPDTFTVNFSTRDGWDRLAWWLQGRRALATRNTPLCVAPPPQCAANADCDDDNPCSADTCSSGSCQHGPATPGTSCAHGNVCNASGQCVECLSAAECDDDSPCTTDSCTSGLCAHGSASSGTACGHGGSCDGAGTCLPPACSVAADCDDDDPCTTDACAGSSCSNGPAPAGVSCAHGNVCNGAGDCVACLSAADCDDDNPCTTDLCTGAACGHGSAPTTTPCGHGSFCNGAGACSP